MGKLGKGKYFRRGRPSLSRCDDCRDEFRRCRFCKHLTRVFRTIGIQEAAALPGDPRHPQLFEGI